MMSAPNSNNLTPEPPALAEALRLLARGLWPVPITAVDADVPSPGKQPIGHEWGRSRHTPETLRAIFLANPGAGVGLKLGKDGGIIDVEVDDPATGEATFYDMMGGELVETTGWDANRGSHRAFAWDDRLAKYGRTIIKVGGVEVRIGSAEAGGKQLQSVVPPSLKADGTPRRWNGVDEIAPLPDAFFAYIDAALEAAKPKSTTARTIPIYHPTPFGMSPADRAYRYLFSPGFPESVSGDRGHDKLYRAACELIDGFGLSVDAARPILHEYNRLKANPPESDGQIEHKLGDAAKNNPTPSLRRLNAPMPGQNVNSVNNVSGSKVEGAGDSVNSVENVSVYRWEEPELIDRLAPMPFPMDVLPVGLADLCRSGAAAMQCPEDYLGAAALGLAGGAIGLSVALQVKANWTEAANLYIAVVGPPGTKKSPAIRLLARALWDIDRELREQHRQEREEAADGDAPPVLHQLTIDDATREAAAAVLAANPRGLSLVKDELSGWVASLNAYKQGRGDDKQFWLSVNSGSLVKVNRKGSPEPLIIPRPFIGVVGALTPAGLPGIRAERIDDGWLDRILFSYPDPVLSLSWTEEEVPHPLLEDWSDAIRRLWNRPMMYDDRMRERPFVVHFTADAKAVWVEWFNGHKAEGADPDFPRSLRGPWSKLEGYCARLALILSQIHQAYDPDGAGPPQDVDVLAAWGATRLISYFKDHFRRASLELSRPADRPEAADAILRWVERHHIKAFSRRAACRAYPRFEPSDIDRALSWLINRHCIAERPAPPRPPGRPGRCPSARFDVNPALLGGADGIDKFDEIHPADE